MGAGPKAKWVVDVPYDLFLKLEELRGGLSRREFLELVAKDDKIAELASLKRRVKELENELERMKVTMLKQKA